MQRKIDLGEDKNLFEFDPKSTTKPMMTFLMDDMPKTGDEALNEARKASWNNWINSEPLLISHTDEAGTAYMFFISDSMKNKVIILFVFDYCLIQCRRALSYVLEWNRRYGSAGLLVIGIHTPIFDFGRDKKNVLDAVRDLKITFPVVMDNDFNIWRSLENQYWPRLVLIDSAGKTKADLIGELGYGGFEKNMQILLRELSPGLACPPVIKPLRAIDREDYNVPPTSPELFFGLKKKQRFGNATPVGGHNEIVYYTDDSAGAYAPDLPYLSGAWAATQESIYAVPHREENKITINFTATDVYIVARSKAKNVLDISQSTKIQVLIDKKPVHDDCVGPDAAINEYRRCISSIRDPRPYHLATKLDHKTHELTIINEEAGTDVVELFAIFFEHRG